MPREFEWQFWSGQRQLWFPSAIPKPTSVATTTAFLAIARLKPGVSHAHARSEMEAVGSRLQQQYPKEDANMGATVSP